MKYYSQYYVHDLFELQESLSGLSKSNRWGKLADRLPWSKIECNPCACLIILSKITYINVKYN